MDGEAGRVGEWSIYMVTPPRLATLADPPLKGRDKKDYSPSNFFALPPASAARVVASKLSTELM